MSTKNQPLSNDIRQKIKRIRGNLSQTEFAKRVGINRSLISSYESGQKFPSMASLKKLADYGRVSVDYLLGIEDTPYRKLTPEEDNLVYLWGKLPLGFRALFTNLLEKLTEHNLSEQDEKARTTK